MDARSLVVPSLFSLALIGCATDRDDTADVAQLGTRIVPAKGERAALEPLDWKTVDARLAELGLGGGSSVLDFVPDEGLYGFREQIVRADECAIAEGSIRFDHDIQNVSGTRGTYDDSFLANGERDPALTISCELSGHTYRCASTRTQIDFSLLGLAAVVTIQNDDFGVWSGSSPSFTGAFPFSLTCAGADCDREPASNLFGTISGRMPCTGIEVSRFGR